jgi:hypothetical protein
MRFDMHHSCLGTKSVSSSGFLADSFRMEMDAGPQPIDALLTELGLDNHAIVAASTDQLTHKMVAKARKGRRLTRHSQEKVLRAFETATKGKDPEVTYTMKDLFNYDGR